MFRAAAVGVPVRVAVLCLLLAGVSAQPHRGASSHPAEPALAQRVDEARLRADVRRLVEFGPRIGGSPSGDQSAEWIAGRFRELGLEVRVVEDPPHQAFWHRGWNLRVGRTDSRIESAYPLGFSGARADAAAVRLHYASDVGTAGSPGRWQGQAVYTRSPAGRVVAVLAAAGVTPAFVVTSAPHREGRYTDWASVGALAADAAPSYPVFAVSLNDGRRLEAAANAGESVSATLDTTVATRPPRTVVATLPGRDRQRYWLVSAHGDSDSGGPGADDNASGVSVVLGAAAAWSAARSTGELDTPPVSIRFVVWGTEYHSARAYIAREGRALGNCLGVINIDQAGTGAEREAVYFESNEVPWNARLLRTFEQVGRDFVGRPGFWPEFATTPSQGGTDSYAFLPRRYRGEGNTPLRIPATTVYSAAWDEPRVLPQTPGWEDSGQADPTRVVVDYSRYYHSSGDTPANTTEREPQNMVRVARAVAISLLRLVYDAGGARP